MTLEQLRIFVAVAERQHVTRAAEALNMTQSAVSAAVSALEARHGVALFDRVGRGVALNPAGEVFLQEARAVLARAAQAENALADLSGLDRGRLRIQASQTIANHWLPARLAAYHALRPGISLEVAIGNTAQVAAAVAEGAAELGLVEGTVEHADLSRQVIARDRLCLVVGRGHPWTAAPPRTREDLLASSWVLREAGSGTRAALDLALRPWGLAAKDLTVAMTLPANEAVRGAVEAGAGAAVLSRELSALRIETGRLVEVALPMPEREFFLLRHKSRYRTQAAEAFVAQLQSDRINRTD
jgi:DNA-binding transcriptional LysR family regulator